MSLLQRMTITNPQRVFWMTWLGQLISLLGSGLTSFAVGVQIFRDTQSTTQFALLTFFYFAPMVVLAPIAGAYIDRWDRRRAMLLADLGSGVSTMFIFALVLAGNHGLMEVRPWHFYLPVGLAACFGAFRWPAFYATVALVVPKEHLSRANAMGDIAHGAGQILSPIIAGALVARVGLQGVVLADLSSFVFAVGTLLLVRFPRPTASKEGQVGKGSLPQEIRQGWAFIRARPGLFGLLCYSLLTNFILALVSVLITPLVLSFTDIPTLGVILSIAGTGALAGGVMMGVWGGPKRLILGMFGFQILSGLVLFLAAPLPSVPIVATAATLYLFCTPPMSACSAAIWQRKIPPDLQGRTSSVKRMFVLCAPPLASLAAGPLADHMFEPWMAPGGLLASSFGVVFGVGKGRGIALLFLFLGIVVLINVLMAWLNPRVRNVEAELPDALPEVPTPASLSDSDVAPLTPSPGATPS
ncbi:MFS transporter [Corallococcus sp. H22C18031201]|uniref:MFS transporter n=1 Tax=Citreicoccus inhibens TaxID=2849499 RepID=UPI000E732C54|nr:MFS transporter [Citreicoccus inhibens]MBU8895095.1 MFS transporter [Citreicoccus inhibens]RJS27242.1 MFS transporter [Corallococcus sp. H22C18031201]